MDVRLPDGTVIQNVPDGTTKADLVAKLKSNGMAVPSEWVKPAETTVMQDIAQHGKNALGGFIRGAGSIGATLARPFESAAENEDRRTRIDANMADLVGADPNSMVYKGFKIGGEVSGTAGAGGVVGNALSRIPMLAKFAPGFIEAVKTSGMTAGNGGAVANALTRAAGGAISGGAQAALVDPQDAVTGAAAIGGALPVVAKVVGMGAKAAGSALRGNPIANEVVALADRAKQLGIDIPADRIADSKPLNALASALNYVPLSGRAASETKMIDQLQKAASNTFGQDSSNVTLALRKANADLGGKFDAFLKTNPVKVDAEFKTQATDILNKAEQELGQDALKPIQSKIAEIFTKGANGEIDGQAAYNIKKDLDRIGKGTGNEAYHARELRDSLLEALNRSVGPDAAGEFAVLRKQYGNMRSLEKIAQNGAEGDISVARLANMKNINNPDLQELADIAAQFVKGREGQHGAMQRAVAGTAGMASGGGLVPALAVGATLGRLTNATLNSQVAKNLVTGTSNPAIGNAIEKAARFGYRTAPALSGQ